MLLVHALCSQCRIIIKRNHFFNNLIFWSIKMSSILINPWFIHSFFNNPLLFPRQQISLVLSKVFLILTNDTLSWVIETITSIISTFCNLFWPLNFINQQSFTIGTKSLKLLSIKTTILNSTIIPIFIFELQIIEEEIFSGN